MLASYMTIPAYQEIMPEILKIADTTESFKVRDIIDQLADKFNLSEDERKRYYTSKNTNIFYDRSQWAKSYLKISGLLEPVRRGVFKITPKGKAALERNDDQAIIDIVQNFIRKRGDNYKYNQPVPINECNKEEHKVSPTPLELIDKGIQEINNNLALDLIEKIQEMTPDFFERLVVKLLVGMGYGGSVSEAGEAIGRTNDEGIDGIIKEDTLGLEVIYIQAKRWSNVVSRPEIQKFAGALLGKNARKGVFITTSNFTKGALDYAQNIDSKIILINGEDLARYMIEFNVGVTTVETYCVKDIDIDFFEE